MRTLMALMMTLAVAGCDYHRALGNNMKPRPTSPLPGAGTGTATAGSTPTLAWIPADEADRYQVQLDDSCQLGRTCDFPSPEIDVFVTDPSYVPATPLTVPSGSRRQTYCWRVRGCHQASCGEWSDPRCFVVGADKTLNRDLDGDGYADVVIGAPRYAVNDNELGRVGVYLGGAQLPEQPAIVHEGQPYVPIGRGVATVGDVNGDGYGDYAFTTAGDSSNLNGNGVPGGAQVFFGGPVLKQQPDVTFRQKTQNDQVLQVAGCGDLNGDGYDDLALMAVIYGTGGGDVTTTVAIHFGGPALASAPPLLVAPPDAQQMVGYLAAGGDVNGDGYADLLVALMSRSTSGGGAQVVYGGPAMDGVPDVVVPWPNGITPGFSPALAGLGDVNGDGFADFAVGVSNYTGMGRDQGGFARVFLGGASPGATAALTLAEPFGGESFAFSVLAPGDVDGDGHGDLAVLSTGTDYPVTSSDGHTQSTQTRAGMASLFAGGATPASTPFATAVAPTDHPYVLGGTAVDLDGDGVAELLLGQSNERGSTMTGSAQVAIYRASNGYTTPARVLVAFKTGDDFGTAMSQ